MLNIFENRPLFSSVCNNKNNYATCHIWFSLSLSVGKHIRKRDYGCSHWPHMKVKWKTGCHRRWEMWYPVACTEILKGRGKITVCSRHWRRHFSARFGSQEGTLARLLVADPPSDIVKFGELVFTDFLSWKTFTVLHSVVSIQSVTTPWHNWLRGRAFPMSSMVFQILDF